MSEKKYLLALDQGTTSSRSIIFDKEGNIISLSKHEFSQIYPKEGWVEHDPKEILNSQIAVIKESLNSKNIDIKLIDSAGITNQRETTIVWDKFTGEPVYNAIVWQCRRTADYCNQLKSEGYDNIVYKKTGLELDAYFSATKLRWILDNVDGARIRAEKGTLLFGTVDTYILWHLTGGKIHATDHTNASRTMLYNIHELKWDEELLQKFHIPESMLPKVKFSSDDYGDIDESFFGAKIPVRALVGDQQAALFGQLCVETGNVKNTYGTGCFMLMNTGSTAVKSKRGLITTLAASYSGAISYALEGSVFIGGAVVQWLRDELRMINNAAESEILAMSVPDTAGVYVVPAFVGLGAPFWDPNVRGIITGLTRGAKREHIVRAALESIAFQVFDVFHAMERDLGKDILALAVDGGASANNFLMQFQADLLNIPVVRPSVVETTALGAVYLAGLKSGFFSSIEEIRSIKEKQCEKFLPAIDINLRQNLIKGWTLAVAQCRTNKEQQ